MKIAVVGLWHLGCVTAACLAKHHDVIAYDPNNHTIAALKQNQSPIFEPGLNELIQSGAASNQLHFTTEKNKLTNAEIIWITFDTPVDENDIADVTSVINEIETIFPYLQNNALVIISSQVPVGTTRKLLQTCTALFSGKTITFACSPENLRLGKAIDVFSKPDRIVFGIENEADKIRIQTLLKPYTENIIWMSIESAEMTKHALNAFLATSVVFINELSMLCERYGADAREVERGLKSEERIGPKAYLRPGNAIAGGTLARDVNYLIQLGQQENLATPLFSALLTSNHAHKQWVCRRLIDVLKDLKNKTIATLGLTYKVGTDTLRRSTAVETCEWLKQQGVNVIAYDPALKQLPHELSHTIHLKSTLKEAIQDVDAVLISTEHPEFTSLSIEDLLNHTKQPIVFDAGGYLAKHLSNDERIRYFSVGR